MRIKYDLAYSLVVTAAVLLAGYAICFVPLPPERTLTKSVSPDGTRTATYSWRASGYWGAYSTDGAYAYLTIRDRATGRLIARHSAFADVTEEAEVRPAPMSRWYHASNSRGEQVDPVNWQGSLSLAARFDSLPSYSSRPVTEPCVRRPTQ